MQMKTGLFLLTILSVSAAAQSQGTAPAMVKPGQRICEVQAFADPQSGPVKVRAEANSIARVLGTLPLSRDDDGRPKGAYVTIVSMHRNWALVADAVSWDNQTKGPYGWVEARHLRFTLQTSHGFASPNPQSTIMVTSDWVMPDQIQALEDCVGDWVLAKVRTNRNTYRAWFRGACSNQETTCDGVKGDEIVAVTPKRDEK